MTSLIGAYNLFVDSFLYRPIGIRNGQLASKSIMMILEFCSRRDRAQHSECRLRTHEGKETTARHYVFISDNTQNMFGERHLSP